MHRLNVAARLLAAAFALVLSLAPLAAGDGPATTIVPEFGPSISADKGDPQLTLRHLRGRTVLLMFGQSWCGICNGWTPELIKQLEEAYANDPGIALVFIKTDGGADSAKKYLAERGDPANWLVLADAKGAYMTTVMGGESLWMYAVIDPQGRRVEADRAGFFSPEGGRKRFTLADGRIARQFAAQTRTLGLAATHPTSVGRARRLAEAGAWTEALVDAQRAGPAVFASFRSDLLAALERRRLEWTAQAASGAVRAERYAAMIQLRELATRLQGSDLGRLAARTVAQLGADAELRKESAAERDWLAMLGRAVKLPASDRGKAMAAAVAPFAKAHPETLFLRIAEETAAYRAPDTGQR